MSTRLRRQSRHMLAAFGSILMPHSQHNMRCVVVVGIYSCVIAEFGSRLNKDGEPKDEPTFSAGYPGQDPCHMRKSEHSNNLFTSVY